MIAPTKPIAWERVATAARNATASTETRPRLGRSSTRTSVQAKSTASG